MIDVHDVNRLPDWAKRKDEDPAVVLYRALDRIEKRAKNAGDLNTGSDVDIIRAMLEQL